MTITIIIAMSGVILSLIVFLFAPLRDRLYNNIFSSKPIFQIQEQVLSNGATLVVRAPASRSNRDKPLGICISEIFIDDISDPQILNGYSTWKIDLSSGKIPIYLLNTKGENVVKFYTDRSKISSDMKFYIPDGFYIFEKDINASLVQDQTTAETSNEIALQLRSRRTIELTAKSYEVSDAVSSRSPYLRWEPTHDGTEVTICNISEFSLQSKNQSSIVTSDQYSWVFAFQNASGISITGLTIGHSIPGYCQGGVLSFSNSNKIRISNCDLFGSGTYAFSFDNCVNVVISDSIIRECTYAIALLGNTRSVRFKNCTFRANGPFDGFSLEGASSDIIFEHCTFEGNGFDYEIGHSVTADRYSMFSIKSFVAVKRPPVRMINCRFINNGYLKLSNIDGFVELIGSDFGAGATTS